MYIRNYKLFYLARGIVNKGEKERLQLERCVVLKL